MVVESKNRSIFRKCWWLKLPPPGGGKFKRKQFLRNKKVIKFSLSSEQLKKLCDTSTIDWHRKNTIPPTSHGTRGANPSRGGIAGRYWSMLDKRWTEVRDKNDTHSRFKQSQLEVVEAATPHRVSKRLRSLRSRRRSEDIESKSCEKRSIKKRKNTNY